MLLGRLIGLIRHAGTHGAAMEIVRNIGPGGPGADRSGSAVSSSAVAGTAPAQPAGDNDASRWRTTAAVTANDVYGLLGIRRPTGAGGTQDRANSVALALRTWQRSSTTPPQAPACGEPGPADGRATGHATPPMTAIRLAPAAGMAGAAQPLAQAPAETSVPRQQDAGPAHASPGHAGQWQAGSSATSVWTQVADFGPGMPRPALQIGDLNILAVSQAERAGIIASCVLNAAMIPGWPPARPPARATAADKHMLRHAAADGRDDPKAVEQPAQLGLADGFVLRLRRSLRRTRGRAKILAPFAWLLGSAVLALDILREELAQNADENQPACSTTSSPDGRTRLSLR